MTNQCAVCQARYTVNFKHFNHRCWTCNHAHIIQPMWLTVSLLAVIEVSHYGIFWMLTGIGRWNW